MKSEKVTLIIFLCSFILACGKTTAPSTYSPFASFRDIPGVTAQEIAAIEALQKERESFIFGGNLSTEVFITENGVDGYISMLCEWLTGLFDIPFRMRVLPWNDLFAQFNEHTVDFLGNLTATEERLKIYSMSDPIAERQLKMMRLRGSPSLDRIASERPPRYAFLRGSIYRDMVAMATNPGSYEIVDVGTIDEAYQALLGGRADVYIEASVTVDFFPAADVYTESFFPLILIPVSMTTANPALEPVISLVTKAIRNGAMPYLHHLYNEANRDYMKYKTSLHLNNEEHEYIAGNPVVNVVANYDNYPVCFYNTREGEWQGIFFDLLAEITAITGLSFNLINKSNDDWPVIYEMVKSGQASLIADLTWTQERTNYFIWPESGPLPDYLALVSKSDYRNIAINEIRNVKVGVARGTVYASTFKQWFPAHPNTVEYENMDMAIAALGRDEVDMVMSSQRRLMFVTHYLELPGYKTNIIFAQPLQTLFGVNKNEAALCSIIDKALEIIDTDGISERWMRKTYDYRVKVAEARLPWFIGAVALTLCVIALVFILFRRVSQQGRHLEKQVHARTAELKAVIDNYKGVIWSVDAEKNITTFGGQYLKKIGVQPSFLLGKNLEAARLKKRHLDIIENVDKTLKGDAQDWISEIDGGLFRSNTSPVFDAAGNVIGVVGSNDDLTELITLQRNLETAVKEAQSANRAKSSFLATMSHEMRTPMNAIIGMTTIAKNSTDTERKNYALNKIEDAAVHLLSVINDVLDISKIEANKLELAPVEFNFEKMLQKIINIINFRMDEKHQKLAINVDKNLPRFVIGDDHRLSQVILNLLSNAVKFSPEWGEIGLDVTLLHEKDGICELRVEVSDNGIGIAPEQQTKLFKAFQQADSGISREFGGTGLGLSISKHIVELMEGKIWVESETDRGSRFIFTVKVGRGADKADFASDPGSKPETGTDGKFTGKKLLVVEDVEINREILVSLLHDTGINIDCAQNGLEAVDTVSADHAQYDAILMDVQMPKMDGLEATRRIRALEKERSMASLPIIAMTAHVFTSDIKECLAAGMNDHIGKPFDIDDVLKKLHKYL